MLIAVPAMRMQSKLPIRLMAMTFLNASRLAAESYEPSLPTVRCAHPMPAELTSTRTGPIDFAISTASTMSSVLVTSTLANAPPISSASSLALVLLQVGDDDLGAALGEQPGDRRADPRRSAGDDCACTTDVHARDDR